MAQVAYEPHLQVDEYDGEPEPAVVCADCGHEGLVEDDRIEVESEIVCRGCAVSRIAGLLEVVFGHEYQRAQRYEAAGRLEAEMPTLQGLLHAARAEINRLRWSSRGGAL